MAVVPAAAAGASKFSTALTVAKVAGTAFSAISAFRQAQANAEIFEQNAAAEEERTRQQVRAAERRRQQVLGQQTAKFAKAGVVPGVGSPLLAFEETFFELGEDIRAIELQGDSAVRTQLGKAAVEKSRGREKLIGGVFGVGESLLGNAIKQRKT